MTSSTEADIRRVAQGARVSLKAAVQLLMSEVMHEVVLRTPVDTGFLRANWVLSIGTQPLSIREARESDGGTGTPPPSPVTVTRLATELNQFEIGDILYFVNNANYVTAIEYGRADQPNRTPAAMLRNTLAIVDVLEERAVEQAKRFRRVNGG